MTQFADVYRGQRVLVTGHTGFKGSWLALWLSRLGARVTGVALDPETQPAHWELLRNLDLGVDDRRADIRDADAMAKVVRAADPAIVFHLAAQPLVRRSYRVPLETWHTNVLGTANVLEACRQHRGVRAVVAITTDKCYENQEWEWAYRENDRLGGHDPYSASKAGSELVVASYRHAFFHADGSPLLASARAGNVIGGGDWSEDRLIPDVARASAAGNPLEIRSPNATRPWQHVLESLSGYLLLGQRLLEGRREFAEAWNFGPDESGNRTVGEVLTELRRNWPSLDWSVTREPQPHEAHRLQLDISKARARLGWRPVWKLEQGIAATAAWYRAWQEQSRLLSQEQLDQFVADARAARLPWCAP